MTAVAYPLSNKVRTGLTLAMFALVIFTLMVMSTLTNIFSGQFNDPDDGQHLAVGDLVAGVIDYYGDVDWYTITLDQGDTVAIWTDSIATDTIVFLDFPEADISTIVYDDDSGSSPFGMSVNAELIYTAPATGRFIIAIANSGGGGGGGYYLGVDPVQPANPTDQAVDIVWQELFNEFAPARLEMGRLSPRTVTDYRWMAAFLSRY